MGHGDSAATPVLSSPRDDGNSVIVRVVENLDLESLAWPIQLAHSVKDALGHVALVVDRHLDTDPGFVSVRDRWIAARLEAGRSIREVQKVRAKCEEGEAGDGDDSDGDRCHQLQPAPSNKV
jgi:hypothetical protein